MSSGESPSPSGLPDEGRVVVADADYSCVLRIDGSVLDFDAIDSALGVRGERRHMTWRANRWRPAVDLQRWEFPEPEDGSCRMWSSLEDALRFTVERMLPVRERLGSYVESDQVYWWIGCFHRAPSSTIYLPRDLAEQLKDLGVPVILSNYFPVSEEQETDEDRARVIEEVDEGGPNHTYRFWIDVAGGPRERYLSRNDGWTPLGEATDFSVGIASVLEQLVGAEIGSKGVHSQRVLVCEHVQYAFDGGPRFSRDHLEALSDLGLDLALIWADEPL